MPRLPRPRKTANLSDSTQHRLDAYALTASAAGIGILAFAQPAEAKIVYTPAHVIIGNPFAIDLNHDGIIDFYLLRWDGIHGGRGLSACQFLYDFTSGIYCSVYSHSTNGIRGIVSSRGLRFDAALRSGARIRPGNRFEHYPHLGFVTGYLSSSGQPSWFGPWFNGGKGVKRRYLGLRFKIKGRFHFGWARITVTTSGKNFTATLTGYAYETIPGKAIVAGQTKGPDVTTVDPASLGHLAAGASAIPAWRSGR